MTVIHTETYLTQDPVYNYNDNSAIFTVALSAVSIPCHIHRQENLNYLLENEVRSGDLVYLRGVFVTGGANDATFIKVQSIMLRTPLKIGKKRKMEDIKDENMSMESLSPPTSTPKPVAPSVSKHEDYLPVDLSFSDYYFMVSGQAYCLLDSCNSYQQVHGTSCKRNIQEKGHLLADTLRQLHRVYNDLMVNGMNRLQVFNFVNTITIFIKTLKEIKEAFPDDILPAKVTINSKVPLPTLIYNAHFNEYTIN
ncbi:uncharacterized protein EV154DRAFT_584945 [Mucor mucedo]|uniref:uncharacterized protein n=1 Tax=Mucor mucedo TaxID=29922 RepID=UPI002220F0AE|nr:uncharacterized protein EV154DRAFT_584945 [Mucor mucedo]KAI7896776.1 hypothetical protein EV154DRAFT_584945 [Mucor mucedo]